ncbi:MAG: hypothetical protein ACXVUE_11830 [Solirubrobacteraceae bacterium]
MTDCTHPSQHRALARRTALVVALFALACAWHPAAARADGDPASDVLATQALFLPQDAGATSTQRAQLSALLETAARSGYPIRVALVASRGDLGSVTALWRQPQTYARFLGQELAFVHKGPLLVVMPNGFGLTRLGRPLPGRAALKGLVAGAGLAPAAITAVRRLAAAAGHQLPVQSVQAPQAGASGDTIAWIVLAAGALVIALAWGLSLRARPLRFGRRSAQSAP